MTGGLDIVNQERKGPHQHQHDTMAPEPDNLDETIGVTEANKKI